MTRSRKRKLLSLERLEPRDCPTLNVIFTGGNLFILGRPDFIPTAKAFPDNGLDIQVTSTTGAVTVTERESGVTLKNYGTYLVRNNLYVGLSDYNSNVNVDLNGQRLNANVILNLGLGDHSPFSAMSSATPNPISIYDSKNVGGASVAGNIVAVNGSGIEDLNIGAQGNSNPDTAGIVVDGDVNVHFPNRIDDSGLTTGDALFISGATDIHGDVNTSGVDNVTIGEDDTAPNSAIRGNLSVSDAGSLNELIVHDYGSVVGNVTVLGSSGSGAFEPDTLTIGSTNVASFVGGNVTANLTGGNDKFLVLNSGTTIEGNVWYTGAGVSTVVLSDQANGPSTFLGDTALNLSSGNNIVSSFGSFTGNLTVTGGDGNNNLNAFNPSVSGNLTLDLGNGANGVAFAGSLNGGTLASTTGNGNDNVSFAGTGPYALNAHLGSGANTLAFDADPLSSANIVFATHVATDSLTQTGTLNGPFTLVNYP